MNQMHVTMKPQVTPLYYNFIKAMSWQQCALTSFGSEQPTADMGLWHRHAAATAAEQRANK